MQEAAVLLGDRYELGPVLGEGGMGRVHRGVDRTLRRPVAIKVLAPPYDRDRGFVERFRREAHAAARLNHPNIVTVFDSGEHAGKQYIVMELVEGETLGARLRRTGPMEPEDVVTVGGEIAAALAEAHGRGIVHRDVKPGNVMLADDGRIKVLDFGIARASGAEAVTRTGLVLGSASYLAPEQAQGASADERSDVYALGCVLFQMATGRAPFVADDPVAALYQHVNEPVPRPSELRPVPPALEAVILRCLEKDPSARFASAAQLGAALRAVSLEGGAGTTGDDARTTDVMAPVPMAETARIDRVGPTAPGEVSEAPSARPRSRRGAAIAVVVAAVLIVAGLLALMDPFDAWNPRREAREARRQAAAAQDEPRPTDDGVLAVTGDPAVDEPYAALLAAISAGEDLGVVATEAADALRDRAEAIAAAYTTGDLGAVDEAVASFTEELGRRTELGEIEPSTALEIRGALEALVVAMAEGLPGETPTGATGPGATGESGTSGGDGGGDGKDHGGGPPAHSNAGGNGNGNGKD